MIASTTVFPLFFLPFLLNQNVILAGLYGEEFEEDFAVSTLGNSSNLTDAIGEDTGAELVEPPEDDVTITLEPQPEEIVIARPIPTLDSRPRSSADALPPKPTSAAGNNNNSNNGSLSYSAQVAEQFSSSYRQTPSQERGRLDAARLAQFQVGGQNQNQTAGAPSGSSSAGGEVRPIRPSEMKDEGCVFLSFPPSGLDVVVVREVEGRCAPSVSLSTAEQCVSYLAVVSHTPTKSLSTCVYTQMLRRASRSFSSYFPYLATHPR